MPSNGKTYRTASIVIHGQPFVKRPGQQVHASSTQRRHCKPDTSTARAINQGRRDRKRPSHQIESWERDTTDSSRSANESRVKHSWPGGFSGASIFVLRYQRVETTLQETARRSASCSSTVRPMVNAINPVNWLDASIAEDRRTTYGYYGPRRRCGDRPGNPGRGERSPRRSTRTRAHRRRRWLRPPGWSHERRVPPRRPQRPAVADDSIDTVFCVRPTPAVLALAVSSLNRLHIHRPSRGSSCGLQQMKPFVWIYTAIYAHHLKPWE
jgi:hypothetical protein